MYVIEVTTAAPLPTRFSREEDAESQEVRKIKDLRIRVLRVLKNLSYITTTKIVDIYLYLSEYYLFP